MDDFELTRDLLHCKAKFFGEPRYDCAILNDDSPDITLVRLHGLYRCKVARKRWEDIAHVSYFRETSYKPWNPWEGCCVREQETKKEFILVKYLVRGAHMIPVFNAPSSRLNHYYLDDCIDNDMFVRTTPELQLV